MLVDNVTLSLSSNLLEEFLRLVEIPLVLRGYPLLDLASILVEVVFASSLLTWMAHGYLPRIHTLTLSWVGVLSLSRVLALVLSWVLSMPLALTVTLVRLHRLAR